MKVLKIIAKIALGLDGFVYAMGFSVAPPADPQAAGALRMVWLEAVTLDPNPDAESSRKRHPYFY